MTSQHQGLAAGRWQQLTFPEQMANIGSEVERSLKWKAKDNAPYFQKASDRALELIDLTLASVKTPARLREVARVREALTDHLFGTNEFRSSVESWRKYFAAFTHAARP